MSNKPDAIVFFDLDGTLFTSQVDVAQSTIESIAKLQKNNIKPVIATGRTVCEVTDIMSKSGIDSIVAMNGQSIFFQGEHIFSNNIDNKIIDRIIDYSKNSTGIPLSFYNERLMRISQFGDPAIKFYQYVKQPIPPVDPQIHYKDSIQMMLLLCEQGEQDYIEHFPELTFIRNTPYCVDVFNHGGSKAFGIKKLIENKNFYDVPTYAFGDGPNDIEMFQAVDHPIAMGNSVEAIKELAEFITDDNNHDGITKGLIKAGLI